MRKRDSRFEDDSVFDERGVLLPGRTARTSITMRDGIDRPLTHDEMLQRFIRQDTERRSHPHVSDGVDAPFSMNRPGPRYLRGGNRGQQHIIDAQRQKVADAYEQYENELQQAYKTPASNAVVTGAGSHGHEFSGGQIGDPCSLNGRPGRLIEGDDGELICKANADNAANRNRTDAMSLAELQLEHRNTMNEVYAAHEAWLQDQWKTR